MTSVRSTVATLCVAAASWAGAQQPRPPVPPLKGHVQSRAGLPLSDAEVRVDGVRGSVRSDAQGAFSIPNVPKGIQTITVRRIGYLPAVAAVDVPQADNRLIVVLVPMRAELDTVKVVGQVNVLAGVVVDEHDRPIAGASVELAGGRRSSTITGDDGWFTFTAVRSGPVIFRVLKEGYEGATQSVRLEDWRGVVVHMSHVDATLSASRRAILSDLGNSAKVVWTETQTRLAQRPLHAVVVTSEDLAPFGDLPLGDAIMRAPIASILMTDLQQNHNTACVLLNGARMVGESSLDSYDAGDVEFVELYPPGAEPSGSVAMHMQIAGCSQTFSLATDRRGIFYAVIWFKK